MPSLKKTVLCFVFASLFSAPFCKCTEDNPRSFSRTVKSDLRTIKRGFLYGTGLITATFLFWKLLQTYHFLKQLNMEARTNTFQPITFDDVIGLDEVIEEVYEVVDFLKNPTKYQALGAKIPRGILFEGPPGAGKTMLARALAYEANANFIYKSGSEFVNKYVGVGADTVRNMFLEAKKISIATKKPTIIFVDEIDSIGSREKSYLSGVDATINELLNQMDGFFKDDRVIVIAATNSIQSLDTALLRPGRFDRKITVPLPTQDGRKKIFKYYLDKIALNSSLQPEEIASHFAKQTTGLSGADLANLVNESALTAAREKAVMITMKHLETAYDRISLGLKTKLDRTPEQLKRTSSHEAGHTVMALLTKQPVSKVTILSRGHAEGVTFTKEKYEYTSMYTKDELLDQIMISQGGFVAEQIMFGIKTPGAQSDLQHANKLAQKMVNSFGMGDGALESRTIDSVSSEASKKEFDDAVSKILEECKKQTIEMLTNKKELLEKMTEALLEKETLGEQEIYEIAKLFGLAL